MQVASPRTAVLKRTSSCNAFLVELVEAGIPGTRHSGLTLRSVHQVGGFKKQARTPDTSSVNSSRSRGRGNSDA